MRSNVYSSKLKKKKNIYTIITDTVERLNHDTEKTFINILLGLFLLYMLK